MFDDEDLSGLSEEERAAIVGDSDNEKAALQAAIDEGTQALKAVSGSDDGEDGDQSVATGNDTPAGSQGDDQQPGAAAAPAVESAAAAAEAAKVASPESRESSTNPGFVPMFNADPVDGFDDKMRALNEDKAKAFKQFTDGEIDASAYAQAEQNYLDQRDQLRSAKERAELANSMKEQTEQQRWMWEVDQFKKTALRADGVDYKEDKFNNALDRWVKVLAADPENAEQSGEWLLNEAHKNVMLQYGVTKPATAAAASAAAARQGRQPDLSKIPPANLAKVPAAAEGDSGSSEFAHLDNLEGIALERALAKMSSEQQERYLAGQ